MTHEMTAVTCNVSVEN